MISAEKDVLWCIWIIVDFSERSLLIPYYTQMKKKNPFLQLYLPLIKKPKKKVDFKETWWLRGTGTGGSAGIVLCGGFNCGNGRHHISLGQGGVVRWHRLIYLLLHVVVPLEKSLEPCMCNWNRTSVGVNDRCRLWWLFLFLFTSSFWFCPKNLWQFQSLFSLSYPFSTSCEILKIAKDLSWFPREERALSVYYIAVQMTQHQTTAFRCFTKNPIGMGFMSKWAHTTNSYYFGINNLHLYLITTWLPIRRSVL